MMPHLISQYSKAHEVGDESVLLYRHCAPQTCVTRFNEHSRFADHHAYSRDDVQLLLQSHRSIVCTAKDAVKLQPLWSCDNALWVMEQKIEAEDGLALDIIAYLSAVKQGK